MDLIFHIKFVFNTTVDKQCCFYQINFLLTNVISVHIRPTVPAATFTNVFLVDVYVHANLLYGFSMLGPAIISRSLGNHNHFFPFWNNSAKPHPRILISPADPYIKQVFFLDQSSYFQLN